MLSAGLGARRRRTHARLEALNADSRLLSRVAGDRLAAKSISRLPATEHSQTQLPTGAGSFPNDSLGRYSITQHVQQPGVCTYIMPRSLMRDQKHEGLKKRSGCDCYEPKRCHSRDNLKDQRQPLHPLTERRQESHVVMYPRTSKWCYMEMATLTRSPACAESATTTCAVPHTTV